MCSEQPSRESDSDQAANSAIAQNFVQGVPRRHISVEVCFDEFEQNFGNQSNSVVSILVALSAAFTSKHSMLGKPYKLSMVAESRRVEKKSSHRLHGWHVQNS